MRTLGLAALLAVSAFVQDSKATPQVRPRAIYLITIDGTRWQDVFAADARSRLPTLYSRFVDHGMAVGRDSQFVASGYNHVSLPGYLEITRGHPSTDCPDNYCRPNPLGTTVTDFFQTSAVFSGWDQIDLTFTHKPNTVVNIGGHIRSQAWKNLGLVDRAQPLWDPEYRADVATMESALDWQRLSKVDTTRFVWVSLGNTDEWAHAGNRKEYMRALTESDKFIGQLMSSVPPDEDATFIVTADHGRSDPDWTSHGDAASGRLWLMMTGAGVPARGWVSYDTTRSLSDVLPTIRTLVEPNTPQKGSLL